MLTLADWPIILMGLCSILLLGGLSWRVWRYKERRIATITIVGLEDDETVDYEILVRVPVPYSPAVAT